MQISSLEAQPPSLLIDRQETHFNLCEAAVSTGPEGRGWGMLRPPGLSRRSAQREAGWVGVPNSEFRIPNCRSVDLLDASLGAFDLRAEAGARPVHWTPGLVGEETERVVNESFGKPSHAE